MKRLSLVLLLAAFSVLFGAFALTDIELAEWLSSAKVDNKTCTSDLNFTCFSCDYAALCVATAIPGEFDAYGQNCTYPYVCVVGLSGGCLNKSDISFVPPASECLCDTVTTDHADPYSDHHYVMCAGGYTYFIDCGNEIYNSTLDQCVAPPTTTTVTTPPPTTTPTPSPCTSAGKFPIMNDCHYYTICIKSGANGIVTPCATDNYFNPDNKTCTPVPTIPFKCTKTGTYADPIDCREYYVCSGTTLISTECCPPGNRTSPPPAKPSICVDNNGACTDLYYCNFT